MYYRKNLKNKERVIKNLDEKTKKCKFFLSIIF